LDFDFLGSQITWVNGTRDLGPQVRTWTESETVKELFELTSKLFSWLSFELNVPCGDFQGFPSSPGTIGIRVRRTAHSIVIHQIQYLGLDKAISLSHQQWRARHYWREAFSSNSPLFKFLGLFKAIELAFIIRGRVQESQDVDEEAMGRWMSKYSSRNLDPQLAGMVEASGGIGNLMRQLRDSICHVESLGKYSNASAFTPGSYENITMTNLALPVLEEMARDIIEMKTDPSILVHRP
jgi:hypothetical protein